MKLTSENTEISLRRRLAKLAVPIFIETLLIMMLGAIDTVMLSQHSDESVAAVGVVNQIVMLCFLVFEVINIGTSVLCSQYIGARLQKRMVTAVGISLLVNLLVGAAVSAFLFFEARTILGWMGLSGQLMPDGLSYMRIVGAFAFFQAISLTASAALRAANKAVYPMSVTLIVNLLNIAGNYTLIFGKFGLPELGAEGAAISTAASRGVAMLVLLFLLHRHLVPRFPLSYFRPFPWEEVRNLLKIGLPSAGEQLSYSSSQLIITYFINMLGVEALAARTYCVNIIMFVYLFCIAIAQAGAICIGHLIGEEKKNAAYRLGNYVARRAVMITLILSFLLAISGSFIVEELTQNPEIISLCTTILWIDVALEIGRPINIYATNALRAAGDVNYPFVMGVIVMWSIAVGAGYLLGITFGFGIIGMWWAFVADENLRGILFTIRWKSKKWQSKGFVRRAA